MEQQQVTRRVDVCGRGLEQGCGVLVCGVVRLQRQERKVQALALVEAKAESTCVVEAKRRGDNDHAGQRKAVRPLGHGRHVHESACANTEVESDDRHQAAS